LKEQVLKPVPPKGEGLYPVEWKKIKSSRSDHRTAVHTLYSDSVGILDGDDSGRAWRFCWTHSAGTGPGKASADGELPRSTSEHQSNDEGVTSGLMV
jgi:hypothetical protein